MNARVFISVLTLLALTGASASAQIVAPETAEQAESEDRTLPQCPGDPRCAGDDVSMEEEADTTRMAREPLEPSSPIAGTERLPRCPGDPRCGEREGEIVPRQTLRPDQ